MTRVWLRRTATALAFGVVWVALVAPDHPLQVAPGGFVRVPLELAALLLAGALLPRRGRTTVVAAAGLGLVVVTMLRLLDLGFYTAFDRPFDPAVDWRYAPAAVGLLHSSIGRQATVSVLGVGGLTLLALVAALPLATTAVVRSASHHRRTALFGAVALMVAWSALALAGVRSDGADVASGSSVTLLADRAAGVVPSLRAEAAFRSATTGDPLRTAPPDRLLRALRGKDVLLVFVESYGRVAVQDSWFAPQVDRALRHGTTRLGRAGFAARSGFLTSPTFGGLSWLAHSTLQSGLWVDSQPRYDALVASDRATLSSAFHAAGWRTVSDIPSDEGAWPQGAFYGFDAQYGAQDVGYHGPKFGYGAVPDQFTLAALGRLELRPGPRPPVMAEVDLVSSHVPWSPLPRMLPWRQLGDGRVFLSMPHGHSGLNGVWPDTHREQSAYATSIAYSWRALTSYVAHAHDPNLVVLALGDHQPATVVTGYHSGHDVPVSVIAKDPRVLDRIGGWGWTPGLLPRPDAPVWPMDSFRDRFVTAFSPGQDLTGGAH